MRTDSETDLHGLFVEKTEIHVFQAVEAALRRAWILKQCPNPKTSMLAPYGVDSIPASIKYCERSNAEGLAPRSVLGAKIYPEPMQ